MAKHITGVVRWFDGSKGYGYIHAESGERVAFFLEQTVRGPQASDVTRLN